jgi:hypothetical protein
VIARTERKILLKCVRGSLATELARLVDPLACGDLAEVVADTTAVFSEVERLLDRAANRLLDLLNEPDSTLAVSAAKVDDATILLAGLEPGARESRPLSPAFAASVADVEQRVERQFRTLSMSMLHAVRRALSDLGDAVAAAYESAERDAAKSVCDDLVALARRARFGEDDQRHPFSQLWPRLVASRVEVERAPHPLAARAS